MIRIINNLLYDVKSTTGIPYFNLYWFYFSLFGMCNYA